MRSFDGLSEVVSDSARHTIERCDFLSEAAISGRCENFEGHFWILREDPVLCRAFQSTGSFRRLVGSFIGDSDRNTAGCTDFRSDAAIFGRCGNFEGQHWIQRENLDLRRAFQLMRSSHGLVGSRRRFRPKLSRKQQLSVENGDFWSMLKL